MNGQTRDFYDARVFLNEKIRHSHRRVSANPIKLHSNITCLSANLQNLPKPPKTLTCLPKPSKAFQSLPKPSKPYQSFPKPPRTSQSLPKLPKASQRVPKLPKASQSLGERHTMLKPQPPKAPQGFSKPSQSLPKPNPPKHDKAIQSLTKAPKASPSLPKPFKPSQRLPIPPKASQSLAKPQGARTNGK